MKEPEPIRLFLCGDVMTGRGVDQVLPVPSKPELHEPYIDDARAYVELVERANGAIPRPVASDYIWGDALAELERARVDLRIINLETSITQSENYWRGKAIHYRMHPRNIRCISAAHIDCCCLANNHVLDWGYDGLDETLRTLDAAGIAHAGAGKNVREAAAPAVFEVHEKGHVLVFSCGLPTSGIPWEWGATDKRPGVYLLEDASERSARQILDTIRVFNREGDVVVVSIHWGDNWGYQLGEEEIRFAHRLIENGVHIVYGHSSHHVKTIELYRGQLVLYGCGDFVNDYEGIGGYESFRSELTLMYLADVDLLHGRLLEARFVPMRVARLRLNRASEAEGKWLGNLLSELGAPRGTQVEISSDGSLIPRASNKQ